MSVIRSSIFVPPFCFGCKHVTTLFPTGADLKCEVSVKCNDFSHRRVTVLTFCRVGHSFKVPSCFCLRKNHSLLKLEVGLLCFSRACVTFLHILYLLHYFCVVVCCSGLFPQLLETVNTFVSYLKVSIVLSRISFIIKPIWKKNETLFLSTKSRHVKILF